MSERQTEAELDERETVLVENPDEEASRPFRRSTHRLRHSSLLQLMI